MVIDSEAPLPRLGLGLARIRQGDLAGGRREIETAVALDPRRASLRTWLGRAYLEEGLTQKAAAQFALAKERDPDDPNAFLFSALERFEANDPIGALRQIEAAEAVGGRRAVVRDEGGLAEDQSVRIIAAGRVLDVLGFNVLAAQKAARAVDLYPTSPDAHRFLFDAYRGRPGFEVAQTSELLRYQLLSPPSNQPVQPSLSEPGHALLTIAGVTRPTFYEFSPLFNRDGWFFFASGAVGNHGTWGDEVSFSRLAGNMSLSVGQYHFEDDGFRANDDVRHNVVAALAKYAPTPEITLTVEARSRTTTQGNRFLASDSPDERIEDSIEPSLLRLGVHAQPSRDLDILAVATRSRFEDDLETTNLVDSDESVRQRRSTDTSGLELQGIHRLAVGNVTAGVSFARTRGDGSIDGSTPTSFKEDQASVYAYSTFALLRQLELTVGLSYDDVSYSTVGEVSFAGIPLGSVEIFDVSSSQVNPKLGVRAEVSEGVIVRGAVARTLKRPFIADQTIEPTTIAGFTQFFDDVDATDAWMSGIGIDLRFAPNLWAGAEYVHRSLSIPTREDAAVEAFDGEEAFLSGYANATLGPRLALSAGVQLVDSRSENPDVSANTRTTLAPIGARYFHPSGLFAAAEAIWFDQSIDSADARRNESGAVLNGAIGYRMPRNRGLISVEADNILDQKLNTQSVLVNSTRPSARPLADEFRIVARMIFSF
jgi:hypothetical protein